MGVGTLSWATSAVSQVTVAGDWLMVKQAGPGKLTVTDAKGDVAMVTIADVLQSNGVIHVIDTVLLPM